MGTINEALNFLSGIAALAAAGLWFKSATVKVKFDESPDKDGMIPGGIVDEHNNDILESASRGNYWSMWAAVAAGVAALFQSVALFVK